MIDLVRAFCRLALVACAGLAISTASADTGSGPRRPIRITFLGNAGWQIEDGKKTILVDPYITEFRKDRADTQQISAGDPIAVPDTAGIDAHIHKADYILITHGHYNHMIDAPYIAKKTGAVIICHESAANIARAYGVGEEMTPENVDPRRISKQQLIVVRGGEDFQFDGFSLAVIPSLHTPLFAKRYNDGFWAGTTRPGLKLPLHESDYVEGGTLIYLLRIAGHQIFIMASMNYIEREITGLRPDIAIIGAGVSRNENRDYTGRLMRALGDPAIVFPSHWDDYGTKPRSVAVKEVSAFRAEVSRCFPAQQVHNTGLFRSDCPQLAEAQPFSRE
jgi:L-ascorbate metabolism protein UlaG (beta-lactamase superfamily)